MLTSANACYALVDDGVVNFRRRCKLMNFSVILRDRQINQKVCVMSASFPALDHVSLAREHAKLENYEASLRSYQNARNEITCQIEMCRNPSVLSDWNQLLKDVIAEEASVHRIKVTVDKILDQLGSEPKDAPEAQLPPPETSLRSAELRIQKPRRVPVLDRPAQKIVNVPVQKNPVIQKRGDKKPVRPPPPQKVVVSHQKREEKPKLTDNPLVQQITDMGILVREPNVLWESIAGLAQVKKLLRQNLVILPMRPDICKGLLAPWKSVLFYGPPGTGKTFLAKAVATECQRTFFNVTSATITSKWHGESEKLVAYLFDLAEQMAPSTIFFDEIDSVASQRGGGGEHEASRRMKAQLLTKLEGIDSSSDTSSVFVLAATNFPWDLDEALLRRFQKRIYIPLPDVEGRLQILKMNISEMVEDDFDMDKWAKALEGYSCADIANLCRDAAQAVFEKRAADIDPDEWVNMPAEDAKVIITDEDFADAVRRRKSSVDASSLKRYEQWRREKGAE